MIHSMSGGVLASGELITFVKVELEQGSAWYIAPFFVETGDRVLVTFRGELAEGKVVKRELCTRQTAPVPVRSAPLLEKKL